MPCNFQHPTKGDCQFDLANAELVKTHAGKSFCYFHLGYEDPPAPVPEVKRKEEWTQDEVKRFNTAVFKWIDKAAQFGKAADLCGVVFPGDVSFFAQYAVGNEPLPEVSFRNAEFYREADFHGVQFGGDADFNAAHFHQEARFDNACFVGRAEFRNARFLSRASFEGAEFKLQADFLSARFNKSKNNNLPDESSFRKATFQQNADFREVIFHCDLSFEDAQFGLTFKPSDFSATEFRGSTTFTNTTFKGLATFQDAFFAAEVSFARATFHDIFLLTSGGREPKISIDFSETRFKGMLDFSGLKFLPGTRFNQTTFQGLPNFFDCDVHSSVDLSTARFEYVGVDAIQAYMELRRKMEDRRDRIQQARFHAMEKRCERRTLPKCSFDRFVSWLYDATSGYGQSIIKPLLWLAGITLAFSCIYGLLFYQAAPSDVVARLQSGMSDFVSDLLAFSIQQIVRPFAIWSGGQNSLHDLAAKMLAEDGHALRLIAALQSLISIGLIAASLIGLRWRYRRA